MRRYSEERVNILLENYRFRNSENNLMRLPMEREAALLEIVRQGDWKKAKESKGILWLQKHLGETARDPKKNMEYYTAAGIALESRAAIDGGMEPEDVYDLSDVLMQELEKAETMEEIDEIYKLSLVAFAKGVSYARKKSSSYVIEQCKIYISRHIFQKIMLGDIAAYTGLSEKYISRLFAEKEQITIRDYIQREKSKVACNMLMYSDRSIAEIAQYIGFQTQSNFGVIFRKWMGMTPSEYRGLYHRDNYSFHD